MTRRPALIILALYALLSPAQAQDANQTLFPPEITFAISGGYWEDSSDQKGYYRLFSIRQPDRSAKLALQKMRVTPEGSDVAGTVEITAISDMHLRITGIAPKDASGLVRGVGFHAAVYATSDSGGALKTFEVEIDRNGALQVRASK